MTSDTEQSSNKGINFSKTDKINEILNTLKGINKFKIYDKNGFYIFSGNFSDLTNQFKLINIEDIGGITDINRKTIVKFGYGNEHGFTDRDILPELFFEIQKYLDIQVSIEIKFVKRKFITITGNGIKHPNERDIVELKRIYSEIYFSYRNKLSNETFLVSHGIYPFQKDGEEIRNFQKVDGEVGKHYDAHGFEKKDDFLSLIYILSNGIDQTRDFFTAPFEIPNELRRLIGPGLGTAGGTAFKGGIAILVSGYDKSLLKDGIKYVFINDVYGELIEQFKVCFPSYSFYLLSEQKKVLENID